MPPADDLKSDGETFCRKAAGDRRGRLAGEVERVRERDAVKHGRRLPTADLLRAFLRAGLDGPSGDRHRRRQEKIKVFEEFSHGLIEYGPGQKGSSVFDRVRE